MFTIVIYKTSEQIEELLDMCDCNRFSVSFSLPLLSFCAYFLLYLFSLHSSSMSSRLVGPHHYLFGLCIVTSPQKPVSLISVIFWAVTNTQINEHSMLYLAFCLSNFECLSNFTHTIFVSLDEYDFFVRLNLNSKI